MIKSIPYRNIRSLPEYSSKIFKNIAQKNGFLDIRFITSWKEVVGEDLFEKCYPIKIVHNSLAKTSTLYLKAEDRNLAAFFTHYREAILQKIAFYFGNNTITQIKLCK